MGSDGLEEVIEGIYLGCGLRRVGVGMTYNHYIYTRRLGVPPKKTKSYKMPIQLVLVSFGKMHICIIMDFKFSASQ